MVAAPILVFAYWKKEFHVHVDASSMALGVVLMQPAEGDIDHPIVVSSRKLSTTEKITLQQREKDLRWSMHYRNSDITSWGGILKCTLIILH